MKKGNEERRKAERFFTLKRIKGGAVLQKLCERLCEEDCSAETGQGFLYV